MDNRRFHDGCHAGAMSGQSPPASAYPGWFDEFLAERAIRKPSPHTAKAYRQDFEAIATLVAGTGEDLPRLPATELTKHSLRAAFAAYAETHSAASIRRCWSTWTTLCTYLYTAELIDDDPMPTIGRPKVPKSLPKSYSGDAIANVLAAIDADPQAVGRNEWPERDRAIIFTSLLAGLRADELLHANIGDLRRTDDGAVLQVRGKGNKDRRIPVGQQLLDVLETNLHTRTTRFPPPRRRSAHTDPLSSFSPTAPLFVGADGKRITRGMLDHRVRCGRGGDCRGVASEGTLRSVRRRCGRAGRRPVRRLVCGETSPLCLWSAGDGAGSGGAPCHQGRLEMHFIGEDHIAALSLSSRSP
jgi:site-specific recombinase XerC